jgi:TolA-binding protein
MRDRVGAERREWLEDRIAEVRRTLDYNRFVDGYNRAVELYNDRRYDDAINLLEELLESLPEGNEADSAQALLDDAVAARR